MNTNEIIERFALNKKRVRIGKNVNFNADKIFIGDGVLIGDNVTIDAPEVHIGDYTLIRENTQILGKKSFRMGMCCWVGQNCILDATENMTIGNGVGIGAHSQLWTHIRFGDTLQGCRWEAEKPMVVEDDVWFVGHCLVSPIHARQGAMAMLGSVVTKDLEANHIYAGTPAKDLTDKLGNQYQEVSVDQKFEKLQAKLTSFVKKCVDSGKAGETEIRQAIRIVKDWPERPEAGVSYFNVSNRQYTKSLTDIEIDFMLHLLVPIKFYPRGS